MKKFFLLFLLIVVLFIQTYQAEELLDDNVVIGKIEGKALQLFLQIKIRKGWYIYSVKKTSSSISTKIELLDKAWQLQEIEESSPIKIYDEIFQDFLFVHQNTAEFKLKALQKNNHLIPKVITGNLIFSICNQKSCSLPQRKIFKTEVF